ncbi:MAG: glycosyltransferase [Bacteroidetes bacterium]|nr:glycosyltransferase [Bacteroidota bacterium]
MPLAIVSVTNDLTTDQRVDRTCCTLVKSGYEVLLVGRRMRNSKTLAPRSYRMHRMRLLFDKGPLFYAEYNIALFFFLLMHRHDLVVSNDLDTLPANYFAEQVKHIFSSNRKYKIPNRKSPIFHLHDCHEYFRGVPELVGRKTVTRVWKWIEDRIFPKLEHVIAVNQSVADLYTAEYGNHIEVIRNVPFRKPPTGAGGRGSPNIPGGRKIILYQGAVNIDRGLEEAILSMKYLETDAILVIAGIGDIWESLKQFTVEHGLSEKVRFLGQVPFQELHAITLTADLGLSIEKDVSINYHYCLPNKFLDYIQANIPVLVSPFPEMKSIVDQYNIGEFIDNHHPEALATRMDSMLNNPGKMAMYRENLLRAAGELCWEREEVKLVEILRNDK